MGPPGGDGQNGGAPDGNGQGGEAPSAGSDCDEQTITITADTVITKAVWRYMQPGGDGQPGGNGQDGEAPGKTPR